MRPEAVLIMFAGPAGMLWALLTLPRPATIGAGLGKIAVGALAVPMFFLGGNVAGIVCGAMGVVSALLGLIDLAAVKIALQISETPEQHGRQISSEGTPGAPPNESSP